LFKFASSTFGVDLIFKIIKSTPNVEEASFDDARYRLNVNAYLKANVRGPDLGRFFRDPKF